MSDYLDKRIREIAELPGDHWERYLLAQAMLITFLNQIAENSVSLPHDNQFWEAIEEIRTELQRVQLASYPKGMGS